MFKISSVRSNAACIYWKTPSPSRKVAVDNHNIDVGLRSCHCLGHNPLSRNLNLRFSPPLSVSFKSFSLNSFSRQALTLRLNLNPNLNVNPPCPLSPPPSMLSCPKPEPRQEEAPIPVRIPIPVRNPNPNPRLRRSGKTQTQTPDLAPPKKSTNSQTPDSKIEPLDALPAKKPKKVDVEECIGQLRKKAADFNPKTAAYWEDKPVPFLFLVRAF
ncbi:hypothetical protein CK203_111464 [Vitis vinifera]|uniref:Uncharacterized protein n=1 Tax=Vitis vinifera TaxID=29760 RepID=A0A438F2K8_VITVI|nr:hypothetical protein CK203_111464 [Vitis vinifera]